MGEKDNFEKAFDAIAEMGDKPLNELPADDPAPSAGDPPAGNPDTSSSGQDREPAPAGGDNQDQPVGDEPAGEEPTGEAPVESEDEPEDDPSDQEVLARLAALVNKTQPQQPAPAQQPAPPKQEEPQSPYTAEEQEFLSSYDKDWSDVARGEALKRRAEYQYLANHIFGEISKVVAPILEQVRELSTRTHLSDLETAVSDYGTVRDQVITWAGKQPAYLQVAYNRVIQEGTVDEIKDLIERWRAETGGSAQSAPRAPAAPQRKRDTELPPATKQAADELAPVSSKRSVVQSGGDPSDFEGAFRQFADKV